MYQSVNLSSHSLTLAKVFFRVSLSPLLLGPQYLTSRGTTDRQLWPLIGRGTRNPRFTLSMEILTRHRSSLFRGEEGGGVVMRGGRWDWN